MNDLDGKRWLPFQKSWFHDHSAVPEEFITFFTKRLRPNGEPSTVMTLKGFSGRCQQSARKVALAARKLGRLPLFWEDMLEDSQVADYVLLDLRNRIHTPKALNRFLKWTAPFWSSLGERGILRDRGYLTVFIANEQNAGRLLPLAWQLAFHLSNSFSLKDEKIGCLPSRAPERTQHFETDGRFYYALNFRRDEKILREIDDESG